MPKSPKSNLNEPPPPQSLRRVHPIRVGHPTELLHLDCFPGLQFAIRLCSLCVWLSAFLESLGERSVGGFGIGFWLRSAQSESVGSGDRYSLREDGVVLRGRLVATVNGRR